MVAFPFPFWNPGTARQPSHEASIRLGSGREEFPRDEEYPIFIIFSDSTFSIPPFLAPTCSPQRRKAGWLTFEMYSFNSVFCFLSSLQPVAPHIFTGLIFQPLLSGAILPSSQANPDVQNRILPAGQAGVNPAIQGTESPFLTPSGTDTDDDFEVTTPAGIQRGAHIPEGTTTGSPNGKFAQLEKCLWVSKVNCWVGENTSSWQIQISEISVKSGSPFTWSGLQQCEEIFLLGHQPYRLNPERRHLIACLTYFPF